MAPCLGPEEWALTSCSLTSRSLSVLRLSLSIISSSTELLSAIIQSEGPLVFSFILHIAYLAFENVTNFGGASLSMPALYRMTGSDFAYNLAASLVSTGGMFCCMLLKPLPQAYGISTSLLEVNL